jgi:hypothetical protein
VVSRNAYRGGTTELLRQFRQAMRQQKQTLKALV